MPPINKPRNATRNRPRLIERLESRDLLAVVVAPLSPTEGASFFKEGLATFANTDVSGTIVNYQASVNWGDGTVSAGTIQPTADPNIFRVDGFHTYAENGSYLVGVTVNGTAGTSATGAGQAVVAATLPTAQGVAIAPTVGVPFSGVVARFRDANLLEVPSNFQATITWEVGQSSPGTITGDGNGNFEVSGSHTYTTPGTRTVAISLTETGGTQLAITAQAAVNTLPAIVIAPIEAITPTEGVPYSKVNLATFSQGDVPGNLADYSAVVNWGDGTTSPGAIQATSDPKVFQVGGQHTYAENGPYVLGVTVTSAGGASASLTGQATVSSTPPTAQGVAIAPTVGMPFSGVVARFRDANLLEVPSNFQATITWEVGQSSPGTITGDGNGNFEVSGSHTYTTPGLRTVAISLTETGGSQLAITAQATVGNFAPPPEVSLPFKAGLSVGSDSGAQEDGVTNLSRPTLAGTASPLAIIQLFATPQGATGPVQIGETIADNSGNWSVTVGPLFDGAYDIQGVQAPPSAAPGSPTTLMRLIVDTTSPRVTALAFRPRSRSIVVTFADPGAGLVPSVLTNPAAYTLIGPANTRRVHPNGSILLTSVGTLPSDANTVVISYKGRTRPTSLRITSSVLTDAAGNPLDAKIGRRLSSGGNFVASLSHSLGLGRSKRRS